MTAAAAEEEHMSGIFYLVDPSGEAAPPKSFSMKICHCQFTWAPTTLGHVSPTPWQLSHQLHFVTNAIKLLCERLIEVEGDVSNIKMNESLGCAQNSSQTPNNVGALCTKPQRLTSKVHQEKPSMTSPFPSDLKMPPGSDKSCCYGNICECQLGASGRAVTSCLSSLSSSAAG